MLEHNSSRRKVRPVAEDGEEGDKPASYQGSVRQSTLRTGKKRRAEKELAERARIEQKKADSAAAKAQRQVIKPFDSCIVTLNKMNCEPTGMRVRVSAPRVTTARLPCWVLLVSAKKFIAALCVRDVNKSMCAKLACRFGHSTVNKPPPRPGDIVSF